MSDRRNSVTHRETEKTKEQVLNIQKDIQRKIRKAKHMTNIMREEVKVVINTLRKGEAPGPNGVYHIPDWHF